MIETLTLREVAALLKINKKTAYKLTTQGNIPGSMLAAHVALNAEKLVHGSRAELRNSKEGERI